MIKRVPVRRDRQRAARKEAGVSSPTSARRAAGLGPLPESPLVHKLIMLSAVVFPPLGCVVGGVLLWNHGWLDALNLTMVIVGWAATGMGITIGFHRLATHRSFETYGWVRWLWVLLGTLSVEGSPLVWCAVHRRHHERSDLAGDPHSPRQYGGGWWNSLCGLWHAHVGWLFTGYWSNPQLDRYIPDLLADRSLVLLDKLLWLWVLVSLGLPALIGGLATGTWQGAGLGLLWGGLVRIALTHHITWSINSICHTFGRREYDSGDDSRNNLFCGVFGFGEGWHNNHHAFPTSARHGLQWWQFDSSWLVIRAMQAVGLAWNVKLPSPQALEAKRLTSV